MKGKFLLGFAVVTTLVFSGMLGKGDLFGIKTAFGYGGGGGTVTYNPSVTVQTPSTGTYAPGGVLGISWTSAEGSFTKYKVYYSADNGTTWTSISANATGTSLSWTVPNIAVTLGKIKVEGYNSSDSLLATGTSSGNFAITGTATPPAGTPPATTTPPATDPTIHGSYNAEQARQNNPTIADDKNLTQATGTVYCTAGTLIKSPAFAAVYYCGKDGKRYVFVNDKAFFSWYADFSSVITISAEDMAKIQLGGNITYRPGAKMVKIMTDPKVYAVARGGILRWVTTEAIAIRLYGANWNKLVDDVPDSFFVNYVLGDPITE